MGRRRTKAVTSTAVLVQSTFNNGPGQKQFESGARTVWVGAEARGAGQSGTGTGEKRQVEAGPARHATRDTRHATRVKRRATRDERHAQYTRAVRTAVRGQRCSSGHAMSTDADHSKATGGRVSRHSYRQWQAICVGSRRGTGACVHAGARDGAAPCFYDGDGDCDDACAFCGPLRIPT